MKISEMSVDQATEAIVRISTPIGNICDDAEMMGFIDELEKMDKMPLLDAIGKLLPKFVVCALKTHKQDLYEIIGGLLGIPTKEVGNMNIAETIKAVRESYDDILSGFFTDSVRSKGETGKR